MNMEKYDKHTYEYIFTRDNAFLGLPRRFASEVPVLFPRKITNSATEVKNAITLKRLKVET